MQVTKFSTGGMFAARVVVPEYGDRLFHVWTDESGRLIDAESKRRLGAQTISGRLTPVKPGSPQWRAVAARASYIFRNFDAYSQAPAWP